jgi:hypothetical protein
LIFFQFLMKTMNLLLLTISSSTYVTQKSEFFFLESWNANIVKLSNKRQFFNFPNILQPPWIVITSFWILSSFSFFLTSSCFQVWLKKKAKCIALKHFSNKKKMNLKTCFCCNASKQASTQWIIHSKPIFTIANQQKILLQLSSPHSSEKSPKKNDNENEKKNFHSNLGWRESKVLECHSS